MRLPKRKNIRLKDYDYSQNGAYFVTVCTKDRNPLLSKIVVGDGLRAVPQIEPSQIGIEIKKSIEYLSSNIDGIIIDKYVIMPNHVHMIVKIDQAGGGGAPPLHNIVRRFKTYTTKAYAKIRNSANATLWQRSFYEQIIRGEQDYDEIWNYIKMG